MLKLVAFTRTVAGSKADALRRSEEGQTMAEYGVVLAVITPMVIAALALFSDNVASVLAQVAGILPG